MSAALPLVLLLAAEPCPTEAPPADPDAFVRGLVGAQRQREEALSRYSYDVTELRERLDGKGRVRHREIRVFEVFYVRGRPVRRLVSRDGRALRGRDREDEERRVRELAEALREGRAVTEKPGVRLSRILEGYAFATRAPELLEGRCSLVFDFAPRSDAAGEEADEVPGRLSGRLWVDAEEHAVARLDADNTEGLRFALGIGATVSTLSLRMAFTRMEAGVWLPRRLETFVEGRRFLLSRFRSRRTTTFSNFRRFEVDVREEVHPG